MSKEATAGENGISERHCSCGEAEVRTINSTGNVGFIYRFDTMTEEATLISAGTCVDKEIYIPDVINGYKVTKFLKEVFYNNQNIVSVKIGNNITEIPNEAFRNCAKLATVIIGDKVKSVDA